jgi:hypothetical protein
MQESSSATEDIFAVKFLEAHPFLSPLVREAQVKIKEYFPLSKLTLKVFTDSEDNYLTLLIATTLSVKEAIKKLDQFDEDWWMYNMDRARGKFSINLEFK